jgi:hypothetical protein
MIGAFFGLSAGTAYYLSIMISQLFVVRPPSTWILGIFWLPLLVLKPCIIGLLLGVVLRFLLMLRGLSSPREMTEKGRRILRIVFIILMTASIIAGTWKILRMKANGELDRTNSTCNEKNEGLTQLSSRPAIKPV